MKTKLTITIDKKLLEEFNLKCETESINKPKLLSNMIKKWNNNDNR